MIWVFFLDFWIISRDFLAMSLGKRFMSPKTLSLAPFLMNLVASFPKANLKTLNSSEISFLSRFQFSVENAQKVTKGIFCLTHSSIKGSMTISAACWWPFTEGRPLALAQRRLPSMIIATWFKGVCMKGIISRN